ncbi:MAG TPA: dTDP-4-dehydrorhamnose reductase [Chitinophagaceae bacterium]
MVLRKKIGVTGANGQLGMELRQLSSAWPQYEFIFVSKEQLPIQDVEKVNTFFGKHHPDFLINCAAYTAVDKAESEKELAFLVNAEATAILAKACKENNCRFIHISTDYVFDGTATVPYEINAATNPMSVYGESKLKGEQLAQRENPGSIIIRSSWVYSSFGKNFVKTMIRLMREKNELNVVNDQLGSPTYAADLARTILQIIASGNWHPGIYHYSNNGIISWYDFAVAIKELTGSPCTLHPIPTSQYPTPAKRPAWSVLSTSKIHEVYAVSPIFWRQSLQECLDQSPAG